MPEPFLVRYLQPLLAGRRTECLELIAGALSRTTPAEELLCQVLWPASVQVERLYHDDRISTATEHVASRINRTIADQLQTHLPRRPSNGQRAVVASADGAHEELGAQILTDLLQAGGWDVCFIGGGVPDDEVVALLGQFRPQVLLLFGATPEAVPNTRLLVERLREIGTCPTMNVVVTGGIFNRAEGLWREVGADAYTESLQATLATVNALGPRTPNAPRVGVVKKRHRKRRTAPTPALQRA